VDVLASGGPREYAAALETVLADDGVDAVVVVFTPTLVAGAEDVARAIATAAARHPAGKPVVAAFLTRPDGVLPAVDGPVVPTFEAADEAVFALGRAADRADWLAQAQGEVPEFDDIDRERADAVIAKVSADSGGRWLGAGDRNELLGAYGIPMLCERVVGGLDGALPRDAVEAIAGVVQDPAFGPLVLFGLGGTAAELLGDRVLHLLPLTEVGAAGMVRSLRTSPLLFGYRGSAPVDVSALEAIILRLARLADDHPEVAEVDLNPIFATPDGAVVVDAKVRLQPAPRCQADVRKLRDAWGGRQ
jgi:acyl-CoA synthetase (NDP forming)